MNEKFVTCRTRFVFTIPYHMYICKYFYGQFFSLFGILFFARCHLTLLLFWRPQGSTHTTVGFIPQSALPNLIINIQGLHPKVKNIKWSTPPW